MKLSAAFLLISLGLQAAEFRVNNYGAKGDDNTVNTVAIQKAIDAAAKKGGTVVFAPGIYRTGSIFLKSGTRLQVDKGVEIRGAQDQAAYPVMPTRIAGIEMRWPAALINVYEQSNVKISGQGIIDGDGKKWWDMYWALRAGYEPRGLRWAADYDTQRPRLIQIFKSENVELGGGLTLQRPGFWTVHICYSKKITVDGLTMRNNIGGRGPSTDGIDVDSSSDVLVQNADIECNDDAVVLKAGRDADGLRVNRPTENVVVRDITVRDGAAGITFGSETSGSIRHVEVYRIHVMAPSRNGILFKSASVRGGTIEDISIHDMDIQTGVPTVFAISFNWNPAYSYAKIPEGLTNYPAYYKILTEEVPREQGIPHLRNVRIANLKAAGSKDAFLVDSYQDSPLLGVSFKNIDIQAERAGTIQFAENWTFEGARIQTKDGSLVAIKDSKDIKGLVTK